MMVSRWARADEPKILADRRREADAIELDREVAAIQHCVMALDQLEAEALVRVLDYIDARYRIKPPHVFEE